MQVQYHFNSGSAEIRMRNSQGVTVILNPSYWAIRRVPESERSSLLYGVETDAPSFEIPDDVFFGLHRGIRDYMQIGFKKMDRNAGGFDNPDVVKLKTKVDALEQKAIEALEAVDPHAASMYLAVAVTIPSSVSD